MRHRLTPALLCLALAGGMPQVGAAGIRLLESGIVCPNGIVGTPLAAPDTETGIVHRVPTHMSFDTDARIVPLVHDLRFGIRIENTSRIPAIIRVIARHPPMGPSGRVSQSTEHRLSGHGSLMRVVKLDSPAEMLPGPWSLRVEQAGEIVLAVDFVLRADAPLPDICTARLS